MTTAQHRPSVGRPTPKPRQPARRGSALVVVLILLLLVTSFVLVNARVLYLLKQDLARLDKQQRQHQAQQVPQPQQQQQQNRADAAKAASPVSSP